MKSIPWSLLNVHIRYPHIRLFLLVPFVLRVSVGREREASGHNLLPHFFFDFPSFFFSFSFSSPVYVSLLFHGFLTILLLRVLFVSCNSHELLLEEVGLISRNIRFETTIVSRKRFFLSLLVGFMEID